MSLKEEEERARQALEQGRPRRRWPERDTRPAGFQPGQRASTRLKGRRGGLSAGPRRQSAPAQDNALSHLYLWNVSSLSNTPWQPHTVLAIAKEGLSVRGSASKSAVVVQLTILFWCAINDGGRRRSNVSNRFPHRLTIKTEKIIII